MEKLTASARQLGLSLTPGQLDQFEVFYRELIDWNQRINLTRITGYADVQVKHFLDSLTITLAWPPPSHTRPRVIDVGTGAGMPGLPLKIIWPQIRLVLIEATAKKTDFLRQLIIKLKLDDVEIVPRRAETVAHQPEYRERFDLVVSRAVAPLPTLVELTLPLATIGGAVIAPKKGAIDPEVNQADRAISLLGGRLRAEKSVNLDEFTDTRRLIVIDKVAATPSQYPRRPGIPAKRPLQ